MGRGSSIYPLLHHVKLNVDQGHSSDVSITEQSIIQCHLVNGNQNQKKTDTANLKHNKMQEILSESDRISGMRNMSHVLGSRPFGQNREGEKKSHLSNRKGGGRRISDRLKPGCKQGYLVNE